MAIDERARHQLFQKLEEELGANAAATLMGFLPPVGWADVATKHDVVMMKEDLRQLEERMGLRFEALEHKLTAGFERGLRRQTWAVMGSQAVIFIGLAGLILGRT